MKLFFFISNKRSFKGVLCLTLQFNETETETEMPKIPLSCYNLVMDIRRKIETIQINLNNKLYSA